MNRRHNLLLSLFLIYSLSAFAQDWQKMSKQADNLVNSNPDSAYALFKEIISFSGDSTLIVESYMGIGTAFQYKSEYDTAISMYFIALELAEVLNLQKQLASIKNRLGSLYLGISDLDKAHKYLDEAIAFFQDSQDTISLTMATMNLAGVFFMSGDIQTSIEKLKYSSLLAKASKNYRTEGAIYTNLSMVYQNLGQLDSAILFVSEGIRILGELNDLRGKMLSLKQKALLLESSNKIEQAKDVWSELHEVASKIGNKEGIYDYYLNSSRLERKTDNLDAAYDLIFEALQWRDSTLVKENIELMNEMNAKYETAKKEAQVATLMNENVIKTSQRNLFLIIGISASILLLFALYFYFQKQKSNTQLQEKNQIIKDALTEKEMLIDEIHHRVKNNLQIVSSLLNTQEKLIQDESSRAVIKDTKSRVISMALVHENLQEIQEASSVNADDYLEDLLDSIETTFNNAINPFHFELDIQVKEIPTSLAVHLGLIVNEAVTNSIKYAFAKESCANPRIDIAMKQIGEELSLTVKDNGLGIPHKINESYGIKLIRSLAETKQGNFEILNNNGTTIKVVIPVCHV